MGLLQGKQHRSYQGDLGGAEQTCKEGVVVRSDVIMKKMNIKMSITLHICTRLTRTF